jgi:hypothetical protein
MIAGYRSHSLQKTTVRKEFRQGGVLPHAKKQRKSRKARFSSKRGKRKVFFGARAEKYFSLTSPARSDRAA